MQNKSSQCGPFQKSSVFPQPTPQTPTMMKSVGVLMTSRMFNYIEQQAARSFTVYKFDTFSQRQEFISQNPTSIRAILANSKNGVNSEMINALPKLEIVSSFSVGIDKIDLIRCKEKGIKVTNTPDVLTDEVADSAIALMLATLKRICAADRFVRSGLWKNGEFQLSTKFTGKSVGIIGLGRIGKAIAKRAESFNCAISYFSRSEKPYPNYKYYSNVLDLATNCQILVVACELNKETRHIVNRKVIDALGPNGVIINIGRGPHIDEPELVSALVEGRLGGAGLDVYEHEPEVPAQLLGLDNVVLLPHIGSATWETRKAMADLAIQNLEAHFSNKPLLTPVV